MPSEHKAGETVSFPVGDQTLVITPIPFGKLKKVIAIVADVSKDFESKDIKDDLLKIVPRIVDKYVTEFFPLILNPATHPFLTTEWIENNLTIPLMKQLIVAAIAVNGLGDFFLKTVSKTPAPAAVESNEKTSATPSESTGSITSSDSPTDGGPKT